METPLATSPESTLGSENKVQIGKEPKIEQVNLFICQVKLSGFSYSTWAKSSADVLIYEVIADGVSGWGESTMKYGAYRMARKYAKQLVGKPAFDLERLLDPALFSNTSLYHWYSGIDRRVRQVREGFSIALHDLACKLKNQSFYQHIGRAPTRSKASLMPVIHVGPPEKMLKIFSAWYDDGFHIFKIKLRGNAMEDAEAIRLIRKQVPDVKIYVGDANFGYKDVNELIKAGRLLSELGVEYFQNPIRKPISRYRSFSKKMNIKFTADSSAYWPNTRRVIHWQAADLMNLHPNCMGGIDRLYNVVDYSTVHHVSSIMGSSGFLGIQDKAFQKIAFTLDPKHPTENFGLKYYFQSGRSKFYSFEDGKRSELIQSPFPVKDGKIEDKNEIGFGVEVDRDALKQLTSQKEVFK